MIKKRIQQEDDCVINLHCLEEENRVSCLEEENIHLTNNKDTQEKPKNVLPQEKALNKPKTEPTIV